MEEVEEPLFLFAQKSAARLPDPRAEMEPGVVFLLEILFYLFIVFVTTVVSSSYGSAMQEKLSRS